MANGNVAEVISSECLFFFFKFGRSLEKVIACIPPPDCHAFHKVWLKFENCGSSSLLKILTSEILQNASSKVSPVSLHNQPFSRYVCMFISVHEDRNTILPT